MIRRPPNRNMQELPLERIESVPANLPCVILTFIGILLMITSGGIIVFWLAYRHGLNMGLAALRQLEPPREEPLPARYVVNDDFLVPGHSFDSSTAFIFSALYLLEAHYRSKGVGYEYIGKSQYLELSRPLLANYIKETCRNSSEETESYCKVEDAPDDHLLFSSRININSSMSVFPVMANVSNFNNPLEFHLGESSVLSGVASTKRSLLSTGQPHSISIPMPMARFWFPCSLDNDKNEFCINKLRSCIYNESEFCFYKDFPIDGDFTGGEATEIVAGPRQNLILLAYNDFFIPDKIYTNSDMESGGFILKNGRGVIGHSMEYLLGKITKQQENRICSDIKNVFFWIPASYECAKLNFNDISKCNEKFHLVKGDKIVSGATELKCINKLYCELDKKYVLFASNENNLSAHIDFLNTGTPYGSVIKLDPNNITIEHIYNLPFQYLYYGFEPAKIASQNSVENCGHLFYSYNALRKFSASLSTNSPNMRIYHVNIQWAKKSFPFLSKRYDYTKLIESLQNISFLNLSEMFSF